jgi:hypothetical protein
MTDEFKSELRKAFANTTLLVVGAFFSTSRHLHYEITVDGTPHDPGRFLEAGRYLVGIFDLGGLAFRGRGG